MAQQIKKPLEKSIKFFTEIAVTVMALVLSLATAFSFNRSLISLYEQEMTDLLNYVDAHIDHDDLALCVSTLERSEKYNELQAFMDDVYSNHNISYLYIITPVQTDDGPDLMDVVTALEPEDYAAGEGKVFYLGNLMHDFYDQKTMEGFQRIADAGTPTFYENPSEYGTSYTGVLPLRDSQDKVFALLCLDMPLDQIHRVVNSDVLLHLLLILLLGALFIFFFLKWMRINVTAPITALEASVTSFAEISHREHDPTLLSFNDPNISTGNEVESLSRAVAQMSSDMRDYAINILHARDQVDELQSSVHHISIIAMQDGLTKLRNKTAYLHEAERLNKEIQMGNARFAIVMIDLNYLKRINDTYGHERGDEYLLGASQAICDVYQHSPVFRVGGDEFVIIVENRDYAQRDRLFELMHLFFDAFEHDEWVDPWLRYSASMGQATYEDGDESVDAVFKRADTLMYKEKVLHHAGREG